MIGDDPELLSEDLRFTAEHLFNDKNSCRCDLSVGHICESCVVHSLMIRAAAEIEKLRGRKKMKGEDVLKLPVAEFTGANFLGKNIYVIRSMPGLYRMKCDKDKDLTQIVHARRCCTRGKSWAETLFVRNRELEDRLYLAILSGREPTPQK